ncbi:biotin synthetase [Thermosulfidibacter takaii ABI70S6]|uniref:Biotin synthase n=1 Tax=Thermosulfidibacter takaii (strain DSM 17441 / JCM 13301 / NBRC 103674 / ABI70S6) TaxID=1298851 RepID=A0A0S3QSU0_THET7|nr:biotin synthase BioB [Thermosulfidibacter takaii]BAT71367.1 biotin synthetase [Thermosulfidibacter takaii ABI70S6]
MDLLGLDWRELFCKALKLNKELNKPFEFCSIINAKSGLCDRGCAFCAQAYPQKTKAPVYPLVSVEEMVKGAEQAEQNGALRYSIVTSGKRITDKEFEVILKAVKAIKNTTGLKVDVSIGIIPRDYLRELKSAGVERIHHNLETSERFYPNVTKKIEWREKFNFAQVVKEEGLELCCGGLLGLGEEEEDWKLLADALCELEPDSVPINFLIPIPGTPFENVKRLTPVDCVRIVSYFRLRLPKSEIRICGGREQNLRELQALAALVVNGFMVGGYLTRPGRDPSLDEQLIQDLGLKLLSFDSVHNKR